MDHTQFKAVGSKEVAQPKQRPIILTGSNRWWTADEKQMPGLIMAQCADLAGFFHVRQTQIPRTLRDLSPAVRQDVLSHMNDEPCYDGDD